MGIIDLLMLLDDFVNLCQHTSHGIFTTLLSAQCPPASPPEKPIATHHVQRRDPIVYAQ